MSASNRVGRESRKTDRTGQFAPLSHIFFSPPFLIFRRFLVRNYTVCIYTALSFQENVRKRHRVCAAGLDSLTTFLLGKKTRRGRPRRLWPSTKLYPFSCGESGRPIVESGKRRQGVARLLSDMAGNVVWLVN